MLLMAVMPVGEKFSDEKSESGQASEVQGCRVECFEHMTAILEASACFVIFRNQPASDSDRRVACPRPRRLVRERIKIRQPAEKADLSTDFRRAALP
jgi:hypothetical protein